MNNNKERRKHELLQLLQGVAQIRPEDAESTQQKDAELITQARRGDRSAFSQLIQRYDDNVYSYVKQMIGADKDAFQAACTVFVKAHSRLAPFHGNVSFKSYLLRIAEQEALKHTLHKQGKWYAGYVPMPLYQWYQKMVAPEEPSEELSESKTGACRDIHGLLSAYLDNELSETDTLRVEAHLAECDQCGFDYEHLLETADMVSRFGSMHAPASLRVAINEALDTSSVWEQWFAHPGYLPVPQLASVGAMVLVIVLGILFTSQQTQLRQKDTLLRLRDSQLRTVRSVARGSSVITLNPFVIFTGKIVSEGLPPEAGELVSAIIPDAELEKAPKPRFISGDLTSVGDEVKAYIHTIQGKITEDQVFPYANLAIRKITAMFPLSSARVSGFLDRLEEKAPESDELSKIEVTSVEIYLIDMR